MTPTLSQVPAIACAIALLASQIWLGGRLGDTDVPWVEMPWSQLEKWNPVLYRTMSFGHVPAAVDWLWMRSLQDPSYQHVPEGVHPPAFYDLDLATDLDPAYYEAYVDGGLHLVVVRDDEPGSETLLLKAERFRREELGKYPAEFRGQFWSEPWQVPITLGYIYLLEIHDLPKASEAFRTAGAMEGAPFHVKAMAERFAKPGGIFEVAHRVLDSIKRTSRDDRLKEELESKRHSIEVLAFLDLVDREFRSKRQSWAGFLANNPKFAKDPWGGRIDLDADGKVTTTTRYEKVFNLR